MTTLPVDAADVAAPIRVSVVCSPSSRVLDRSDLTLPAGSTVGEAIAASGLLQRHPQLQPLALAHEGLQAGVWGQRRSAASVLADGDRVELYRPLTVDPKEARRLRYRAQGESGRQSRIRARRQQGRGRATPASDAVPDTPA